MLSRHKVYSILYSSTLILPSNRRGVAVEAVTVADCCGREQEALLLHGGKYMVYIVII